MTEEPITSALRLTICLYRLGIGDHLYTISEMSRLGVSTVSSICQEVCQVLVDHLWNETVSTHMPQTEEEFKQKILDMEEFWQFPCCWKAINGSRIPMKCPAGRLQSFSCAGVVASQVDYKLENNENYCSTTTPPV